MKNPIEVARQINGNKITAVITFQTHTNDGKEIINPPCCVAFRSEDDPYSKDVIFLRNEDKTLKWFQTRQEAANAAFTEASKSI